MHSIGGMPCLLRGRLLRLRAAAARGSPCALLPPQVRSGAAAAAAAAISNATSTVSLNSISTGITSASGAQAAVGAPRAALVVIGDEILSGSVVDTNTPWLAKLLHSRGVDLIRVSYIPDTRAEIRDTVRDAVARVGPSGFVFTSGGIGPTHDDVTYEAVAEAMGVSLQLHEPTVARMRESYAKRGMGLNEARLRMATLPAPSEVLFTEGLWVPLVNCGGVYVLPGIPRLFQAMIAAHQDRFTGIASSSAALFTQLGESFIAIQLTEVAARHSRVAIGSYPNTSPEAEADAAPYKVKLSLTSRDPDALAAAVADVRQTLGDIWVEHSPPPSPPPL